MWITSAFSTVAQRMAKSLVLIKRRNEQGMEDEKVPESLWIRGMGAGGSRRQGRRTRMEAAMMDEKKLDQRTASPVKQVYVAWH